MGAIISLASALATTAAGCGPTRFSSQVNDKAARAVAAAKAAHADETAPYEFTAATEYLGKAREEGAYAEYQVAIRYGQRAEELAVRARAVAEEKSGPQPGRPDGQNDGQGEGGSSVDPTSAPAGAPRIEPPSPSQDSP